MNHAIKIMHYTIAAQEKADGAAGKGASYTRAEQSLGLYIQQIKERHYGEA